MPFNLKHIIASIVMYFIINISCHAAITITVDGSTVQPVTAYSGVPSTLDAVVTNCPSANYYYETWYYKNDGSASCSGGTPVFISQAINNSCTTNPSVNYTWPSTGQKTVCYGYYPCSGFLSYLVCILAYATNTVNTVQAFRVDVGTTTAKNIFLSTGNTETLGGLTFSNGTIIEYNPTTNSSSIFLNGNLFSLNENISGIHVLASGNVILTTGNGATLGGLTFRDGDLVEYNPTTDTATLYFNEDLFSRNADINAVYLKSNGNIILSTTGGVTLGGLTFRDGDLAEYNPNNNTATLFFSEDNFSRNMDIDGVHVLDSGNLLISTTVTATLGGLTFSDGSIAEYNPTSDSATLYFNENLFSGGADISALSLPVTTAVIHHFEITHDGTALTCEPETISIKPCSNSDCSSVISSDVTVSLIPTGWLGGDTKTITSGAGSFQLSNTTAGSYTLGVSSSSPTASNAVVCVNSSAGNSSCDIVFYDTGFVYDVPTLSSCSTSANITISAVRLDDVTQACVPTFQNTSQTLNFWSSYSSPASGTQQVIINNGAINTTVATSSPGTAIALNFNASGQATITATYNDAGQLTLNSSYTSGSLTLSGSDSFVAVPPKFYVYSDDSNAACASNDASCSAFKATGSNFNLKVRAACTDNSVTPNFQLNSITIAHTNSAPAIAQGSISVSSFNMASGDNGEHTISNLSVTEVGVNTFSATSPSYFGLTGPSGTSAYIGRFYPDHFTIDSTTVTDRSDILGCGDNFTYMDENFKYTFNLRAENTSSALTLNYSGTFAKLNVTTLSEMNYATTDSNSDYSSRTSVSSSGSFSNGIAAVTATVSLARQSTTEIPLTAFSTGINPLDSDSVILGSYNLALTGGSNTHGTLGATELRFGRGIVNNAFGSEFITLKLPWQTQYYVNAQTGFATNNNDSCSPLTSGLIDLSNSASNPAQGITSIAIGAGTTSATINNNPVSAGDANLTFSAPSNSGYTDIDINFSTLDYLQFDWDSNGTHNNNPPTVRATFGSFRGDDRIIYWKELFD